MTCVNEKVKKAGERKDGRDRDRGVEIVIEKYWNHKGDVTTDTVEIKKIK